MKKDFVTRHILAEELGVQMRTIAKWERDGWFPQPEHRISDRLILYRRSDRGTARPPGDAPPSAPRGVTPKQRLKLRRLARGLSYDKTTRTAKLSIYVQGGKGLRRVRRTLHNVVPEWHVKTSAER